MANNSRNFIGDDGTILTVSVNSDGVFPESPYALATRAGSSRGMFLAISMIISITIGLLMALLVTVLIYEFADSEFVNTLSSTYVILPLAALRGAHKYYKKNRKTYYAKADYLLSAKKSMLSALTAILVFIACVYAFTFFIIIAFFVICIKTAKSIFGG